jgi:hypothetical protein
MLLKPASRPNTGVTTVVSVTATVMSASGITTIVTSAVSGTGKTPVLTLRTKTNVVKQVVLDIRPKYSP